jgi:hypothetical protein
MNKFFVYTDANGFAVLVELDAKHGTLVRAWTDVSGGDRVTWHPLEASIDDVRGDLAHGVADLKPVRFPS